MASEVYITDVGYTKVGDHWKSSLSDLAFESARKIVSQSSLKPEGIVVANALSEISSSQQNLGPLIADSLHLEGVETLEVEAAGASGAAAFNVALNMIRSGQWQSALVVGTEKMRDIEPAKVTLAQTLSERAEYSQFFGVSFASLNALLARMYMAENNVTREKLSAFPVIAHRNSSTSEHAQFRKRFSAEEVSRSEIVSDPLRVLDCAPVGDGAASIFLVSGEKLESHQRENGVAVLSSGSASGTVNFFEREKMLEFSSTALAAERALREAGLSIEDIDLFEIHDSYSIIAALVVEALGLSKPGRACEDAASGRFDLNGEFPISTFGGMKGRGYPIGAAGLYQLCEAFLQLSRKAGFNQVPRARQALVHSMSGIDASCFVHVLGTEREGE
jgi:acetyl-CoA C-acetyltransferase